MQIKNLGQILSEYKHVTNVFAKTLEEVYEKMQSENWSPHGEALPFLKRLRLEHTNMSNGDLIRDSEGFWWLVMPYGFQNIGRW